MVTTGISTASWYRLPVGRRMGLILGQSTLTLRVCLLVSFPFLVGITASCPSTSHLFFLGEQRKPWSPLQHCKAPADISFSAWSASLAAFWLGFCFFFFSLASLQTVSHFPVLLPWPESFYHGSLRGGVLSRQAEFAHHFFPIRYSNISSCLQGGFNGAKSILPHYFQGLNQGHLPFCRAEKRISSWILRSRLIPWSGLFPALRAAHAIILPNRPPEQCISMCVSRLGCAHEIAVQVVCSQPPGQLRRSDAQAEESCQPNRCCLDHPLLLCKKVQKIFCEFCQQPEVLLGW